jgi:hypothetical protein
VFVATPEKDITATPGITCMSAILVKIFIENQQV